MKPTKSYLAKLEDLISETDYHLRYEKGNFNAGFCILNQKRIIIVNKYFALEGKISCLNDIIKKIEVNINDLSEKNQKIYQKIIKGNTSIII